MIVTAHQPNFLPGESVITKIQASDGLIWMDFCQYEKEGYTNRNRLPDGSWITVPVAKHPVDTTVQDVKIAQDPKWANKLTNKIRNAYPHLSKDDPLFKILRQPFTHLGVLNEHLFWHLWSSLKLGSKELVVRHQSWLKPTGTISEQHAQMVAQMGGTVYLSGPSGKKYLDEEPFYQRNIRVRYWHHEGPNPSILERYATWRLSSSVL